LLTSSASSSITYIFKLLKSEVILFAVATEPLPIRNLCLTFEPCASHVVPSVAVVAPYSLFLLHHLAGTKEHVFLVVVLFFDYIEVFLLTARDDVVVVFA
jgi:hypothetical protein